MELKQQKKAINHFCLFLKKTLVCDNEISSLSHTSVYLFAPIVIDVPHV